MPARGKVFSSVVGSSVTWRLWVVIAFSFIALAVYAISPSSLFSGIRSAKFQRRKLQLSTVWGEQVSEDNVWPEYPRPQFRRQQWMNLNGIWELREVEDPRERPPFGQTLPERVLVPFPVESDLSGVGRYMMRMWYRRQFEIPSTWKGFRILLNFGAVDWRSQVFINGHDVGMHTGGYDKFSFDITDRLEANGSNEIIVGVYDPTTSADGVPVGKQRSSLGHKDTMILYTSSTGIWQTVWLEPVAAAHLIKADLIPNLDTSSVQLSTTGSPAAHGLLLQVVVTEDLHGAEVAHMDTTLGATISIIIPRPKLWSPDSPHLYQVSMILVDEHAGLTVDNVSAYFGMRKIEVGKDKDGRPRLMLNRNVEMQLGLLDQGFWPDGLYTAPSDEALVYDIQISKAMGYNTLRKHIKVEPDRWYYHADRLGMMVWQDMPCMCGMTNGSWGSDWFQECFNSNRSITTYGKQQFESEMIRHIEEHVNFPSIIMYVIFNEGWGQYETVRVTQLAMRQDPSRLYNGASGWTDADVGHIIDGHNYLGASTYPPNGSRAAVLGEFGGLGMLTKGHMLAASATSYKVYNTTEQLQSAYFTLLEQAKRNMLDPAFSLSAAIYTELSDIENEVNGWLTYDRRVVKADVDQLRALHRSIIEASRDL